MPERHGGVLVVASSGNTAAAFASACTLNEVPSLIVIPKAGFSGLLFSDAIGSCVRIVSLTGGDYSDAIALADRVSQIDGFFPEGGVKNVARRDGSGTTVLSAVEEIGRLSAY